MFFFLDVISPSEGQLKPSKINDSQSLTRFLFQMAHSRGLPLSVEPEGWPMKDPKWVPAVRHILGPIYEPGSVTSRTMLSRALGTSAIRMSTFVTVIHQSRIIYRPTGPACGCCDKIRLLVRAIAKAKCVQIETKIIGRNSVIRKRT